MRERDLAGGRSGSQTNDFAGEVLKKMEIGSGRGRDCVGKAAVSCERCPKNGYNNKKVPSARRRFAEAK